MPTPFTSITEIPDDQLKEFLDMCEVEIKAWKKAQRQCLKEQERRFNEAK